MREASSRTTGRHPPCSPPSGSSPRPGAPPEPVSPPGPRTGRSRPGCHRRARGRSDSRSAFRAEQSRAEQSRAEQSRRASRSAAPPEHPEPRQVRGSRRLHPQLSPRGSSGPAPHGSCPHTRLQTRFLLKMLGIRTSNRPKNKAPLSTGTTEPPETGPLPAVRPTRSPRAPLTLGLTARSAQGLQVPAAF
ncbi:proline-rich protein 2-like isoform X2 [Gallus gallus]|uniref:proline-rich protein 2-like isoform X2 n=1 Tax=Gallus gallus TaxID=9031 RepID=UPI001F003AED|nr:proline-rich protein 2-like isoform X2 [Gallus gallus]